MSSSGHTSLCFACARLVKQPETALDQLLEPRDEACGWGPIDEIMIETDGQMQVLPGGNVPVHDAWFLADAAQGEEEAMRCWGGDAPAKPFAEHPHGRDPARSDAAFPQARGSARHPAEEWHQNAWPSRKPSLQPGWH